MTFDFQYQHNVQICDPEYGHVVVLTTVPCHAHRHASGGVDPITPEAIGAASALGRNLDAYENIDDFWTYGHYLAGNTWVTQGKILGDLPFTSSFTLRVEDFNGKGTRAVQTAFRNNVGSPRRKWRLGSEGNWSAWQE